MATGQQAADVAEAQTKLISQMEEMVVDTFNRMRITCTKKCTNKTFDNPDVMKPEAVCIDRCVAKYMEFHDVIGKKLASDKETYDMLANPPVQKKSDNIYSNSESSSVS